MIDPKEQPDNCPEEYKESPCDGCFFNEYNMVGHPGGSSFHTVEKRYCGWGHWEDDF